MSAYVELYWSGLPSEF